LFIVDGRCTNMSASAADSADAPGPLLGREPELRSGALSLAFLPFRAGLDADVCRFNGHGGLASLMVNEGVLSLPCAKA
jgi:hypothetical protein